MGEDLEEEAGVGEGVEVAEAEVGGGSVASEGVEVAAAHQYYLRHAERRRAASQRPHVVPLRYVVHQHVAFESTSTLHIYIV